MQPGYVEGAGGARIATWELGAGAGGEPDPAAPVLLVAHATGFHARCYRALAQGLADRFRVVGFDLRGHGQSTTPSLAARADGQVPAMDWNRSAEDALAVVDALGLERPLGFGHSCGGTLLLLAEQRRPGTFPTIYAYEPVVVSPVGWEAMAGRNPSTAARRRHPVFASRAAALEHLSTKAPLSSLPGDVLVDYVEGGFEDRPDGTVALRCRPEAEAATYVMAPANDAWHRAPEVRCPVTVACGGGRSDFGLDAATALAHRLPKGRLEEHPDLGHLGPLERPDEIAAAVAAVTTG